MAYGKTYSGKYKIKKPAKYDGDATSVTYRSMWERACFTWCERTADVVKWSSEEIIIPYMDQSRKSNAYPKGKPRRYFMDLRITFKNGETVLVEIKPDKQTKPPRKGKNKQRYLEESVTFVTNQCKWQAADEYAKKRGWKFVVWTEKTLKKMGILKF